MLELSGCIANLERDLATTKKESKTYANLNKALMDENTELKFRKQSLDVAYTGLSSDFTKLQKHHKDDLDVLEKLRGIIKKDVGVMSTLKNQNTELGRGLSDKDLKILLIEKELFDILKIMEKGAKSIKQNFASLIQSYKNALWRIWC
jgi:hypothetical protein